MNKYPVNAVLTRNVTSSVKTSIRKNIFARYILSYRGFVLDKKRDTNLFLSFKFFFFFENYDFGYPRKKPSRSRKSNNLYVRDE